MALQIRVTDDVTVPATNYDFSIPFPPAPISIKTLVKIAIKRARHMGFKRSLICVDVIYEMRFISPSEADTLAVTDNYRTLIISRLPHQQPNYQTWDV